MSKNRIFRVTARLSEKERDALAHYARSHKFKSISEFVRHAIGAYVKGTTAQEMQALMDQEEMLHTLQRLSGHMRLAALNGENHDPGAIAEFSGAINRMTLVLKRVLGKKRKSA